MDGSLMPGRRDFLGISSAALAAAVIGGASGCGPGARATAASAAPTASPGAAIQAAGKLFRAGHFGQADALYKQVLARDPGNPQALAQSGYVAMLSNHLDQARTLLQRALRAQPGNQQAAQNLAATLYRRNDFPAAAAAYRRLGKLSASMAQMLASFGDTTPYQLSGPDATRLPFLRTSPLPMVSISVNGAAPVPVHLDTGAGTLVLEPSYAASVGVTQVARGWGRVGRVRLGDIEVRDVPVALGSENLGLVRAPDGTPDHGIIGTTLMSQFLFTMDYAGAALELRRPAPARLSQVSTQNAGAASMPFWMAGDHFMLTWGSFNGLVPQLLIIDTGGPDIGLGEITPAEATAAGVKLDKGKERRQSAGFVNGKHVYATYIPFTVDSLALGAAVNCGFPGRVLMNSAPPGNLGFAASARVSHSFFQPFAATYDFSSMRLSVRGTASSCHAGT